MKVILLKDCKDGKADTIIEASLGYAKNYLIKNNFAQPYNSITLKELEKRLKNKQLNYEQEKQEALVLKDELEKITLLYKLKTTNDVIHGSITTKKINQSLLEKGIKLKKHILNDVHIASLGISKIKIKLFDDVFAELSIKVEKE
ncbi:MAG: 50S ribosomal protein L9 [Metamycoplasmataceae bacterium]